VCVCVGGGEEGKQAAFFGDETGDQIGFVRVFEVPLLLVTKRPKPR
jgi:hypothetical protein